MRGLTVVTIVALSFSTPARSQPSEVVMRGVGTNSCAKFGADYKRDPRSAEILYMSWALGFLSSQNIANMLEHKPMHILPEPSSISRSIRQDCDRNPLTPFFEIVLNFFKSQPDA